MWNTNLQRPIHLSTCHTRTEKYLWYMRDAKRERSIRLCWWRRSYGARLDPYTSYTDMFHEQSRPTYPLWISSHDAREYCYRLCTESEPWLGCLSIDRSSWHAGCSELSADGTISSSFRNEYLYWCFTAWTCLRSKRFGVWSIWYEVPFLKMIYICWRLRTEDDTINYTHMNGLRLGLCWEGLDRNHRDGARQHSIRNIGNSMVLIWSSYPIQYPLSPILVQYLLLLHIISSSQPIGPNTHSFYSRQYPLLVAYNSRPVRRQLLTPYLYQKRTRRQSLEHGSVQLHICVPQSLTPYR